MNPPTELDPFDGTDGNVALHQEETAVVHGPPVHFWDSDDEDVEEYGIVLESICLYFLINGSFIDHCDDGFL